MRTENESLKKIIEELSRKNKEKEEPYAERLVKELKSSSKKNKL